MLLKVYPENPAPRHISLIVEELKKGGVIVYPTDSVYALGCDMYNQKAIDRICRLVGKKPEEANLSLICYDLSNISEYTVPFETRIFKMMKRALPGPYTFILNSNSKVPKLFKNKKKEIGIRVPDNNIPRDIVRELGNPLITASLSNGDDIAKYPTNPELIYEEFKNRVDLVIDGGMGSDTASTVVDCTGEDIEVIREGKGDLGVVPEPVA